MAMKNIIESLWIIKIGLFKGLSLNEKNKRAIFSLALIATVLLYLKWKNSKRNFLSSLRRNKEVIKQKEIPTPTQSAYPYVGHLFSLGELPAQTIAKWHHQLGPIIKIRMGVRTWISISDRVLAHKVFVTHGAKTSYRPNSTYAHFYTQKGKGIGFAQPGSGWRESRLAVLSILNPNHVEQYMDVIQKESRKLVSRLIKSTIDGGHTNPHRDLELYAFNIISTICFGKSFESINDPEFIELTHTIETSMKLAGLENDLSNFLPAFKIFDYFTDTKNKMENFLAQKRDPLLTKLLKYAENSDQPNMVKLIEEKGLNMTTEEKSVLLFDLIGGGTDTISTTLYWNFALMCNYPKVQQTATQEIDDYVKRNNGKVPTFKDRTDLPYCVSVIKECMRFKSTTSFGLPHAVCEDVEVDGYTIPKDATLITNMEFMHADSNSYQQPEVFNPQRFIQSQKTMQAAANGKLKDRDHFNFGWGRRICPAIYLAEAELFSAFVQILSQSVIEPTDLEKIPDINKIRNIGVNILPDMYNIKVTSRSDSSTDMHIPT